MPSEARPRRLKPALSRPLSARLKSSLFKAEKPELAHENEKTGPPLKAEKSARALKDEGAALALNATAELNQLAAELCGTLSEADDDLSRELLTAIADKWSLWIMKELVEEMAPLRFTRIQERVEGISQKSLTKSLRQLERDGLITRTMYLEVPPRVEYAMTQLGLELIDQVLPLWMWVAHQLPRFNKARVAFDGKKRNGSDS